MPALAEAFPGRGEIDRLSRHARTRCAGSRRASIRALKSAEYSRLLVDFTAAVLALPEAGAGRLAGFVPRCLKKRARRVNERAVDALGSDVEARHRLRVAFKQLRYAVEFFTPLLAGPQLADYHQSAACLQELLGRLNDLAVAAELTAETLPGGKGAVIENWLAAKSESLLPEFRKFLNHFQQQQAPWQRS